MTTKAPAVLTRQINEDGCLSKILVQDVRIWFIVSTKMVAPHFFRCTDYHHCFLKSWAEVNAVSFVQNTYWQDYLPLDQMLRSVWSGERSELLMISCLPFLAGHLRLWRYANACPSDDGLSSKSDSSSLPSLVSVSFIFWCKVLILVSIAAWTVCSTTCWWSQLVWWFLPGNISFHILHVCASFSPKLGLV